MHSSERTKGVEMAEPVPGGGPAGPNRLEPRVSGWQLDGFLFARERYLLEAPAVERMCLFSERVERGVVVERLVVEEDEPASSDPLCKRHGVRQPRVPPANVVAVLAVRVLRVVDEQVGVPRQRGTGYPVEARACESLPQGGFVVGDIG